MARRYAGFWLTTSLAIFAVCAAATFYTHSYYVQAEKTYKYHLNRIVFTPQSNVAQTLAHYQQPANKWLHAQTAFGTATVLATVNVLVQVVRRRNARLAAEDEARTGASD
jgi:hypothetical protein